MSVKEPDFNSNLWIGSWFFWNIGHHPIVYISRWTYWKIEENWIFTSRPMVLLATILWLLRGTLTLLTGKVTVFMGQTGVGKSTLLNKKSHGSQSWNRRNLRQSRPWPSLPSELLVLQPQGQNCRYARLFILGLWSFNGWEPQSGFSKLLLSVATGFRSCAHTRRLVLSSQL